MLFVMNQYFGSPDRSIDYEWKFMKKLILITVIVLTLALVMGCTPGTGIQISTPVPNTKADAAKGQIDVPGFKIQLNAPGVNPVANTADAHGKVAGILVGMWHGLISPGTLVFSFINPNVQMYEVHNNGSQYNAGFLIGVVIILVVLGLLFRRRRPLT
jgi:hypothetical protein